MEMGEEEFEDMMEVKYMGIVGCRQGVVGGMVGEGVWNDIRVVGREGRGEGRRNVGGDDGGLNEDGGGSGGGVIQGGMGGGGG